jgi:hypothetical protein
LGFSKVSTFLSDIYPKLAHFSSGWLPVHLLDKIPDVGKPAIETNKETNSRQITMLTSGNVNKKMPIGRQESRI